MPDQIFLAEPFGADDNVAHGHTMSAKVFSVCLK
jgi:hypothetical protein